VQLVDLSEGRSLTPAATREQIAVRVVEASLFGCVLSLHQGCYGNGSGHLFATSEE